MQIEEAKEKHRSEKMPTVIALSVYRLIALSRITSSPISSPHFTNPMHQIAKLIEGEMSADIPDQRGGTSLMEETEDPGPPKPKRIKV